MTKKSKTKEDKQWLSDVAELGCICCRNMGYGPSPAEIHHTRTGQGMAQRASHKDVLRNEVEALKSTVKNLKGKDFISADSQNLAAIGSDENIFISEKQLQHIHDIEVETTIKGK